MDALYLTLRSATLCSILSNNLITKVLTSRRHIIWIAESKPLCWEIGHPLTVLQYKSTAVKLKKKRSDPETETRVTERKTQFENRNRPASVPQ